MNDNQNDGVEDAKSVADIIAMVDANERDADGEFNQNEYFEALTALKGARLSAQSPEEREAADEKLAELFDRYGRLGSY